jgi:hypothetical protein
MLSIQSTEWKIKLDTQLNLNNTLIVFGKISLLILLFLKETWQLLFMEEINFQLILVKYWKYLVLLIR